MSKQYIVVYTHPEALSYGEEYVVTVEAKDCTDAKYVFYKDYPENRILYLVESSDQIAIGKELPLVFEEHYAKLWYQEQP